MAAQPRATMPAIIMGGCGATADIALRTLCLSDEGIAGVKRVAALRGEHPEQTAGQLIAAALHAMREAGVAC